MKTSEINNFRINRGTGYLLGFAMAIVEAIVVYELSNSLAAAFSAALPIGILMGISLEQRFQGTTESISPVKIKTMLFSLLVGLFVFFTVYVLVRIV